MLKFKSAVKDWLYFLLLTGTLAISIGSKASEDTQRNFLLKHASVLNASLGAIVLERCSLYDSDLSGMGARAFSLEQCTLASQHLVKILDIEPYAIEGEPLSLAFSHRFKELMNDPQVHALLKYFLRPGIELNALRVVTNSTLRSSSLHLSFAELAAVLFQDSGMNLDFYVTEKFGDRPPLVDLFRKSKQKFYQLVAQSDLQRKNLDLTNYKGGATYHFFVIRYLAHKIVQSGVEESAAYFSAFIFNYMYKIDEVQGLRKSVYSEPSQALNLGTAQDIYLGYQAAYGDEIRTVDFASFYQSYTRSPMATLRAIALEKL